MRMVRACWLSRTPWLTAVVTFPPVELNAYAVAADPNRLLAQKCRCTTVTSVLASCPWPVLTPHRLRQGSSCLSWRISPRLRETAENPEPAAASFSVKLQGTRLVSANRWYQHEFDLAQGFVLDRLVNRWNPATPIRVAPSSGLRIRVGDAIYTGRCFRAAVRCGKPPTASISSLTSTRPELPLELTVTITGNETEELSFQTQGRNLGDKPLAAELSLPAFAGLFSRRDGRHPGVLSAIPHRRYCGDRRIARTLWTRVRRAVHRCLQSQGRRGTHAAHR